MQSSHESQQSLEYLIVDKDQVISKHECLHSFSFWKIKMSSTGEEAMHTSSPSSTMFGASCFSGRSKKPQNSQLQDTLCPGKVLF